MPHSVRCPEKCSSGCPYVFRYYTISNVNTTEPASLFQRKSCKSTRFCWLNFSTEARIVRRDVFTRSHRNAVRIRRAGALRDSGSRLPQSRATAHLPGEMVDPGSHKWRPWLGNPASGGWSGGGDSEQTQRAGLAIKLCRYAVHVSRQTLRQPGGLLANDEVSRKCK